MTIPDPSTLTIVDAARGLRDGSLTSLALTEACLGRIARESAKLNAFISVSREAARAEAMLADHELTAGRDRGVLHGIPIAIKDLVDIAGMATTAASQVRASHIADRDATIISHLRNAGAVFVGKTNLHEFAMGTTSEDSAYGPCRHPMDPTRSPGGSSGGSAIAIATGMSLAAVGSDTGGSIRIPSAACGLVGLKPAYGELSCDGVVALSRSLDHVGPMARSVTDAWLLYQGMAGSDPRDAPGWIDTFSDPPMPRTIGVPEDYLFERLQPEVRASVVDAIARLRAEGVAIERVELPHVRQVPAIYLHIVLAEAAAYHARTLEAVPDKYTPPVRLRIDAGRYILAEDYLRALAGRERLRAEVDAVLESHDLLLLPTLPIVAPTIGEAIVRVDDREENVRATMLRLTQPFNLTGHPAITLPIQPGAHGLPVGLQLVGRDTAMLVRHATWCERQLQ